MRSITSYLCAACVVVNWGLVGCTTSTPKLSADKSDSGGVSANDETVVGSFAVSMISAAVEGAVNPPYTAVSGYVSDGPTPELSLDIPIAPPPDATPGCAVYNVDHPTCTGGCGSDNPASPCAAVSAVDKTCVCVADDTCQFSPSKKNIGTVTVNGVATDSGTVELDLLNLNNSYVVGPGPKPLFPPFAEGDTIKIAASGGDYAPFEIAASGIAPLNLTNEPYTLTRASDTDPNAYNPLVITWDPPDLDSGITTSIQVEVNLSRHAGTIALLKCDVEDNGLLTISAGLISQLITAGSIAGNPELNVTRSVTESTKIAPGRVELVIESNIERYPTVEGYASCKVDTDCPTGQVCNGAKYLCEPP